MESKEKERSDPSRSAERCQQNTYAQRSQQKLFPDQKPLQPAILETPKTWLTAEQVPPREKTLYCVKCNGKMICAENKGTRYFRHIENG